MSAEKKVFVAYFYHNGYCLSLGISICFQTPNIEIHLPFGFIRVGWQYPMRKNIGAEMGHKYLYHSFGWHPEQ